MAGLWKTISPRRAEKILKKYDPWIDEVAGRYAVPPELIRAILFKEMTGTDIMDLAADLAVRTGLFRKKDSSTGFGQIFGYVGLNAVNFAVDRGLTDYKSLGLPEGRRLDPRKIADVRTVWRLLNRDPRANIEISALNLLCAAEEMTGRIDFANYTSEETKLILTRYNANIKHVSPYGEEVYALAMKYRKNGERKDRK